MSQQGTVGTRAQQADLEEQIPASEFRQFMQEMREFKTEMREFKTEMREFKQETNRKFDTLIQAGEARDKKIDALIQAGNDQDQQIKQVLDELGNLRKGGNHG